MSDPENPTDSELLTAYGQTGDEAAFEQLARRHVDMIFAVNRRRSGNRQLAEEATQNDQSNEEDPCGRLLPLLDQAIDHLRTPDRD
jgi:hypothetical protein